MTHAPEVEATGRKTRGNGSKLCSKQGVLRLTLSGSETRTALAGWFDEGADP